MPFTLNIPFPSEKETLQKQAEIECLWTPAKRMEALADLLKAADSLAKTNDLREKQWAWHDELEQDWQRRIREFIQKHVPPR